MTQDLNQAYIKSSEDILASSEHVMYVQLSSCIKGVTFIPTLVIWTISRYCQALNAFT